MARSHAFQMPTFVVTVADAIAMVGDDLPMEKNARCWMVLARATRCPRTDAVKVSPSAVTRARGLPSVRCEVTRRTGARAERAHAERRDEATTEVMVK